MDYSSEDQMRRLSSVLFNRASRFIGILKVTGEGFKSEDRIWKDQLFPCRLKVKPVVTLTPETAVPVHNFRDKLTCFTKPKDPRAWGAYFRGSPIKWSVADGELIVQALLNAKEHPVVLPVDKRKLAKRPPVFISKDDTLVTVPDSPPLEAERKELISEDVTDHTRVQASLLKLGADMNFDVWVPRNDRAKIHGGQSF